MQLELKDLRNEIEKLSLDVALIKNTLLEEGELSDWAINELREARKRENKISHEEVKKMISSMN